ncbi:MAG: DMT family transporter [Actinomycetota bacterium]
MTVASERPTQGATQGLAATITSVTLMGFGSVVAKASEIAGPVLALHRSWVAAVLYVGLFLALGGRISRAGLRASAPGGLVFGLQLAFFFSAIQLTTVANATMILAMQPVVVLLFFSRRFDEAVTTRGVVLSAIAVAGVALVVFGSTASPSWSASGDLLAVGALAGWTLYFVFSKQARATTGAVEYQGLSLIFSSLVMVPVAVVFSGTFDPAPQSWWWVAAMVAIPGTGHLLMNWAHSRVALTLVSQLTLFSPVVSVVVAAAVLDGESVNAIQLAGMATVLTALVLLVRLQRAGS